ncbi:hypothetical protein [uncultured Desulfosarcina sp.]|uniref:hypothetical protein n=1 Tax=uncultured Desulfosarcina sp. TaxID=218289 RepID=UPI0029C7C071|nr:hypothetical protein [uncultured Desulfosarcina sp.]
MNAKRDYYKNHVDRRVRIRKLIYFIIFLITFCIILYDSFINALPFHYILFFLLGRMMILVSAKTQKVRQRETDNKFTLERNFTGIVIIVAVIISRIFIFPGILTELNVVFISDAVLLIGTGWFLGRIKLISAKIEEKAFSGFGPVDTLG